MDSWQGLVAELANWSRGSNGVFESPMILVPQETTGRLLKQQLAAQLGIFAGIDVISFDSWIDRCYTQLGDPSPWRSRGLELAVMEVLNDPEFLTDYPIVAQHLATPSRLRSLSKRLAGLLAAYTRESITELAPWFSDPHEASEALPESLAWQPALAAGVAQVLAFDPVDEHLRLIDELSSRPGPRTAVVITTPLPLATQQLLAALGEASDVTVFEVVATQVPESIAWLGSHTPVRQAEVLRDELCHLLLANPELEPRDILIVVPNLAQWWPALSLTFSAVSEPEHPGRALRLMRPPGLTATQPVLRVLAEATRLRDSRATASQVLELLMLEPIRHRWRLPGREELGNLLERGGIRWGLDAAHRSQHGLSGVVTNTWARGLDRLLAAIALAPENPGLGIGPAEGVSTSELEVIGAVAELLSRLRHYAAAATPTTIRGWVERARRFIVETMGLPLSKEALISEALVSLSRLETESTTMLSAADFAWLVDHYASSRKLRPQVGNGNLTVVAEGDLAGVGFPVVVLLGIGDESHLLPPDALPTMLPDPLTSRHALVESYARAAQHLVMVHHSGHATATDHPSIPEVVTSLWRRLGISPQLHLCAATAAAPEAFDGPRPSFDQAGFVAATSHEPPLSLAERRRRAALSLPTVATSAQITLDELVRFLKDPAVAFLNQRAGIRQHHDLDADDSLTVIPSGLESWAIRSRLIDALRTGKDFSEVIAAEARREVLPRGRLGGALIEAEAETINRLWQAAKDDWAAPRQQIPVEIPVADMTLTGLVPVHGDRIVVVSASDLGAAAFEPWVQLLALAAVDRPTSATIHYLHRHYGEQVPAVAEFRPPADPGEALHWLVTAARASRSRLIPVPPGPARVLVEGLAHGGFDRNVWELPTTMWESPWLWRSAVWEQFYDGPAAQLFVDQPLPADPQGPSEFGAFGGWALALHKPLWEALR